MEQAPLVYALVHALDRAITGEMVFRTRQGRAHTVTFFEGAPVRVEPGEEGERIGEDLVAMDYLREDALAKGLLAAQSSRKRLGELLVQADAVDPDVLTEALTLQTARRLARLANLPGDSTFSLYFSARAEPEPFAPWAPLDTLLATVRAWTDRSRLHGTLKWLANKPLSLTQAPGSSPEALMLTSRERDAVAMMRSDAPSLKQLYAKVGKGLSSLLYTLAVTRHFTFTEGKGAPLGVRKTTDLIGDVVQVAVPIAPVIAPSEADVAGGSDDHGSVPPPPEPAQAEPVHVPEPPRVAQPAPAPAPAPPVAPAAPVRRKVSLPAEVEAEAPPPPPPPVPPAAPSRPAMAAAAPPPVVAPSIAPPRQPPRPSFSPPKFVDQGTPPGRIQDTSAPVKNEMSIEFRRAEEAARLHDFETADRLLRERCTEQDAATPEFQALAAWIKANQNKSAVGAAVSDLTFLLMSHNDCQSALYFRGLLLKRSGKEKAALRDFVSVVKANPAHAGALSEIKLLRESMKL